ncbi:hypothetical protein SAMN05428989_0754 [Pseudoxanthomonas sp. GM95]|uniref:hypothetical protein n=1 Tax=Pseudoxanthomonas sp. GM95 TaxID=1881043 RepID=UPI0008AC36E1|nr:hypothetical protein [Pseudoxanthomonas sp. GM95]SEK76265.1 hypothetical protein SAMN05428989_0754 [Pseudoxanthomonas sp. GM95]
MTTPREPLSPEERALAQRLGRGAGPAEPGPSLDARILAMAQAAVDADRTSETPVSSAPPLVASAPATASTPEAVAAPTRPAVMPSRRRPAQRRWTLGLGVAASVLLAVTISWQLRPQRTTERVYETGAASDAAPAPLLQNESPAPAAPMAKVDAAAEAAARPRASVPPAPKAMPLPPPPEAPEIREVPPPAPEPPPAPAPAAPEAAAPAPAMTYSPPAPPSPPAPRASRVTDTEDAFAPPPPPPPPVVATESDQLEARAAAATLAQSVQLKREQAQKSAPGAVEQLRAAQQAASANYALPAVPPQIPRPAADRAVAVSPAANVRRQVAEDRQLSADQWLQAIRRHRFEGDSALARASLQAFVQQHPDVAIPEDLRPLLP